MKETGAWMPMYWSDYFGDTLHLTTEEHGAYLLLIGAYWLRGGPLPADDDYLRRVTRAGKRWCRIKHAVMALFDLEPISDDQNRDSDNRVTVTSEKSKNGLQIRHKRIDFEILRSSARLASARAAGKAGGLAKSKLTTTTTTDLPKEEDSNPLVPSEHPPCGGTPSNGNGHAKVKGTRLAEDWAPSDRAVEFCVNELRCPPTKLSEEHQAFVDWGLSASGPNAVKRNWDRAFVNWIRKEMKRVREVTEREQRWRERRQ